MGIFRRQARGWRSQRGTAGVLGLGLGGLLVALVLGGVVPGEAMASFGQGWIPPIDDDGTQPPGGTGSPPPAPPQSQECMQEYLENSDRCKAIWCQPASFLWFDWLSCDDGNLAACIANAQSVFDCCLHPEECAGE
jgi:hypothetical protein